MKNLRLRFLYYRFRTNNSQPPGDKRNGRTLKQHRGEDYEEDQVEEKGGSGQPSQEWKGRQHNWHSSPQSYQRDKELFLKGHFHREQGNEDAHRTGNENSNSCNEKSTHEDSRKV